VEKTKDLTASQNQSGLCDHAQPNLFHSACRGSGWQTGQKWLERCPMIVRRMGAPQTGQGLSWRW